MTDDAQQHPDEEQLLSFGLGKLGPDASEQIAQHLDDCADCSETIVNLQDDTFVSLVRSSPAPAPVDESELDAAESQAAHPDVTVDVGSGLTGDDKGHPVELPQELRNHPRYEILELIGRGGMGDVYKAQHKLMNRVVALKVIKPELVKNGAAVERFRREVQAAASLRHPNIVTAFDAEQAGDLHFLVMEYVDGTNLDEVVSASGRLSVGEACDYFRQAAEGLQHAHDLGMVHRDIKPHNLMIERQTGTIIGSATVVKILDFGLANFANEVAADELSAADENDAESHVSQVLPPGASIVRQLTQMGAMMGTPDYIAPEQAEDAHTADIRADIYSLGCTFYTLLTGKVPFGEGSVLDKIKAHTQQEARPLSDFRDDVPPEVEAVLVKMMAKDPADRFQTPAEVAEALESVAVHVQPDKPETKPRRAASSPPRRRRPLVLTAVATLFLAIIAAATVFYIQTDNGVVRVEVTDPSLEVTIAGQTITMDDGEKPLTIRPGEQSLIVRRDDADFEFETDSFQIRRSDKIAFKVDYVQGEILVKKDGEAFSKATSLVGEWRGRHRPKEELRLTLNSNGTFEMSVADLEMPERPANRTTGKYTTDFSVSPARLDLLGTTIYAAFDPNGGPPGSGVPTGPKRETVAKRKVEAIIELIDANTLRLSNIEKDNRPKTFDDRALVMHRQGVDRDNPASGVDASVGSGSVSKLELSADLEKNFIQSREHRDNFEEELCTTISYAAGIPNTQWEQFASTENASTDAILGTPLTWFIVRQPSFAGGTGEVDSSAAIRMLTDKPAPMRDVHQAMSPSQSNGYVSLIQPEYIKNLKLDINKEKNLLQGTLEFEAPKLYAGKVDFDVQMDAGRMKVVEFRFPRDGISLSLDENGVWQLLAYKAYSVRNLRQISHAFIFFETEHGYLPSVTTKLPGAKHPVSWRVAILKHLDEDLYSQYKLDEPWYSDHNKKLLEKMPSFYRHPIQPKDDTNACYVTLVGENTATGNGETPITDSDGARTILVTEATTKIPWTKPEDHLVDDKSALPTRRPQRDGWNVVFVDGSAHFISSETSAEVLKALVTRESGEQIENKNGIWKKVGETRNDKIDKTPASNEIDSQPVD